MPWGHSSKSDSSNVIFCLWREVVHRGQFCNTGQGVSCVVNKREAGAVYFTAHLELTFVNKWASSVTRVLHSRVPLRGVSID